MQIIQTIIPEKNKKVLIFVTENDIAQKGGLNCPLHKKEKYIAMFSDHVHYFAKDKFGGKIYKGNKFYKVKPR